MKNNKVYYKKWITVYVYDSNIMVQKDGFKIRYSDKDIQTQCSYGLMKLAILNHINQLWIKYSPRSIRLRKKIKQTNELFDI